MREYATARTIFSFLEFVAWTAVVVGVIGAIAGANASGGASAFRSASSTAAMLGALPGLIFAFLGLIAAAYVQVARAAVDTAEMTGKMLRIAEEGQRLAKRGGQSLGTGRASFSSGVSSPETSKPIGGEIQDSTPKAVKKNAWDVDYKGYVIRRTNDGMFVEDKVFGNILDARTYIDKLPAPKNDDA